MHSCHETSGCIRCNDATSHKVSCHLHHRRWLHIPCRLEELCDSDHYPITISYGSTEISYAIPSWKLRKADWTSFSHEAREQLGCSNPGISLDEFSEKIIAIASNNIPKSKFCVWRHNTVWFNPYVTIGGVFYPPDALFMLLLWNRLELWQRLLWLFLKISWLKNDEKNFQMSPLVFPIWRRKIGNRQKKARKSYVKGLFCF